MKQLLSRLEKTPTADLAEFREGDRLGDAVKELVKVSSTKKDTEAPAAGG